MRNKLRHPDYFIFKKRIESAVKPETLESFRESLTKFVKTNKGEDANDLMVLYLQRENELNPLYEDETLTTLHRNSCGWY